MVLAKGLRSRSRYCSAGTDKVASRAVSALEDRDLTAFVVSFAFVMRQLEYKNGVSPRFFPGRRCALPWAKMLKPVGLKKIEMTPAVGLCSFEPKSHLEY